MRKHGRTTVAQSERDDEVKVGRIAGLALSAAILTMLIPGLAIFLWPERRVAEEPAAIVRVASPPPSFEAVWADARSTLSSLHPPQAAEVEALEAAAEAQPVAAQPRRRTAPAAIPLPPERPTLATPAEAPPAASPPRRERPRVLGVDVPTLDDAARLLDDAAALAGSVTRHLPRI